MKVLMTIIKRISAHQSIILISALLISLLFQAGCSTLNLKSIWRDREVTVDGKSDEWLGGLYYFEDEKYTIGFLNDKNSLYISFITEDRFLRAQVIMQGFSLWFDPDGGKERAFGIRFPLGREKTPDRSMIGDMRSGMDQERIEEFLKDSLGELEILGPGKDVKKRILVEEAKGIEVDLRASGGILVYEIKVPLLHDEEHPYAVGAREGDLIGIGMETPELDMASMRERMGGRRPGGMGMPRGGGGGMRGAGGMGGGRRPQMPKRLKVWMTLRLASDKMTPSDLSF